MLSVSQILRRTHRNMGSDVSKAWEDQSKMLNDRPPAMAIVPNSNLNDNCNQDFQTRILALAYSNLEKSFPQKLSKSNINPGSQRGNRSTPPAA